MYYILYIIRLTSALPATAPDDRSEARISNYRVLRECKSFQTCVSKLCRRFFFLLNYIPVFLSCYYRCRHV